MPHPDLRAVSKRPSRSASWALIVFGMLAGPHSSRAAEGVGADGIPDPSIASSLPPSVASFGGLRPFLAARGVTFQLNDIAEVFGNLSGGLRGGATLDNRLELVIDADLEKLAGWKGGSVHLNGYQINGTGPSRNLVGNILTISNIEALPSTRLYEAWFEQKLADGKLAIRAGQLVADGQFINSDYAGLFVNGTFGWPGLMAADLPSGGPAYPFATTGVRVSYQASDNIAFMAGLFNGDPAGPGRGDPQERNRHGLNFRVSHPPLLISEAQFKYGDKEGAVLPGTLKLGAWRHFGRFGDVRIGTDLLSLASPASNGLPFQHRADHGVYAVLDQQVYALASGEANKGVGVFGRVLAAPSDRNLVDFYVDGGGEFHRGVCRQAGRFVRGRCIVRAHFQSRRGARCRHCLLHRAALPDPKPGNRFRGHLQRAGRARLVRAAHGPIHLPPGREHSGHDRGNADQRCLRCRTSDDDQVLGPAPLGRRRPSFCRARGAVARLTGGEYEGSNHRTRCSRPRWPDRIIRSFRSESEDRRHRLRHLQTVLAGDRWKSGGGARISDMGPRLHERNTCASAAGRRRDFGPDASLVSGRQASAVLARLLREQVRGGLRGCRPGALSNSSQPPRLA